MIVSEEINQIGAALKRLVEAHGAPNSFACSEVSNLTSGVRIMRVGRLANSGLLDKIAEKAGLKGRLEYKGRRFRVDACMCGSTDYTMVDIGDGLERTSCCHCH